MEVWRGCSFWVHRSMSPRLLLVHEPGSSPLRLGAPRPLCVDSRRTRGGRGSSLRHAEPTHYGLGGASSPGVATPSFSEAEPRSGGSGRSVTEPRITATWRTPAICTTGAAGIGGVCAHPALLQLNVRPPLGGYFALLATALLVVGVAGGTLALTKRPRSDRPPRFCVMYALALLFPLPIFIFTSPYAAIAGMTMAHGLQYLLLLGLVAAGDRRRRLDRWRGCAVHAGSPGRSDAECDFPSARRWPATAAVLRGLLGLLAAHFVVDAGIWRLREPFVRAFLSQRVGYLVRPVRPSGVLVSVDDRSVADIELIRGPSFETGGHPD